MNEDERKKLLKLLRKLLGKRTSFYKPKSVKPLPKLSGGSYKKLPSMLKPIKYPSNPDSRYRPESNYKPKTSIKPKTERAGYPPKPWTEPQPYRSKERLIYDPEVKQLLRQVETPLADSELDVEETLKKLEENPALYDKVSDKLLEKMNEESEKLEEAINRENRIEPIETSDQDLTEENKQQEAALEKNNPHEIDGHMFGDTTAGNSQKTEVGEAESHPEEEANHIDEESGSESSEHHEENPGDTYIEDEAEILRDTEAYEARAEPYEAEVTEDLSHENEADALGETGAERGLEGIKPETEGTKETQQIQEAVEQLESLDLSMLEAEALSEPVERETEEEIEPQDC